MGIEAYRVILDVQKYHAPVFSEEKEEIYKNREEEITNNLLRYLGEYRLGVKFDEFFYRKEKDSNGEEHLASVDKGSVREIYRKAIWDRREKGLSVRREVSECLGFEKLEKEFVNSTSDKLFVWVSPPGNKADGYGDYSFTFVGQNVVDEKTGEAKVRVIPYRNILKIEEHKKCLKNFNPQAESFTRDIDFLANPIVFLPTETINTPEDILRFIGESEKVSTGWFNILKRRIKPFIDEYVSLIKNRASVEELTKVKDAIENFVISIKDTLYEKVEVVREGPVSKLELGRMIDLYSREKPPVTAGSCGASGKSTLMEFQDGNKTWEYHNGDCVVCQAKGVDVGPCSICKECEKKFDEKETLVQAA